MRIRRINKKNIFGILMALCAMVFAVVLFAGVYKQASAIETQAATDPFEQSIAGFPESYKTYLRTLHKKYPQWKFVPYNTGINFSTAVTKQYENNRSLMENAYSKFLKSNAWGDYNTATGTYIPKDGATWVSASKNCIAYFMDPRNFLDDTHIYMFEQLEYDPATQTQAGVEAILQGSFMYKTKIGYINTSGKYKTSNILYSKRIMDAAQKSKVSAYYIASRILQEVGSRKNPTYAGMGASGSVSGTYSSAYTGIYNFYNIGASSSANPIANGLSWASSGTTYNRPWTTPGKSIIGGAQYIGEKYINCGQNTTYYQRFNVNGKSSYPLFTHQYMTNIYGAANEGAYTSDAYNSLGIAALPKTFIIPVYTNMPVEGNKVTLGSTAYKTGTVTSGVNVRKKASTEYETIVSLDKGDKVTVLKGVMTKSDFGVRWLTNPYWYKIKVTKNGKTYTGYVAATFISINKEYNVIVGKNFKVPVTLKAADTVYYMSDNPAIATVDANGYVSGKKDGIVTIRAFTSSGSMSAVTVQVYTKGCAYNTTALTLDVGKSKKLPAIVYPTNSTNKKVTYSSSNNKIATVSSTGKIKAKATGTVTITAKADIGGVWAFCKVTVIQPVTAVSISKRSATIQVGYSPKLLATVAPANATYKTVTWKSSNTAVAVVSADGTIRGVAAGSATITARAHNGKSISCVVKVIPKTPVVKVKSRGYNWVKIKWDAAPNVSGYNVYRKNSKGKYVFIAKVSGTKSSYTDKNLITGKGYYYKVKAYRLVGKTSYNSKKSTAVSGVPVPARPKIKSIKSSGSEAVLTWKSVPGAHYYLIYRSTSKNGTYSKIKTVSYKTTKYTNKRLKKGSTYYYKILAYRTVGKRNIYSKYSKIVSLKK